MNLVGGVRLEVISALLTRAALFLGGVACGGGIDDSFSAGIGRDDCRTLLVTARRDAKDSVFWAGVLLDFFNSTEGDAGGSVSAFTTSPDFLSWVSGGFTTAGALSLDRSRVRDDDRIPFRAARKADRDCARVGVTGVSGFDGEEETGESTMVSVASLASAGSLSSFIAA